MIDNRKAVGSKGLNQKLSRLMNEGALIVECFRSGLWGHLSVWGRDDQTELQHPLIPIVVIGSLPVWIVSLKLLVALMQSFVSSVRRA